ncbi:MAG TPA: ABC transporter ATP-binding protein [Candidatus Limnocylindrales bacterium]|nr:ABC transporter ATP-binding protein [Candidatus Limnocylindrales bacterium]
MTLAAQEVSVAVRNLERRFGSFVAVNRVSFEVRKGEIFGFLGPNGAGKSTTIRMLCGLLAPTSGEGMVAGYDLGTGAEKIKQQIGYMSQRFSLYEDLTVEENIDFYGGIYRIPKDQKRERKEWVIEMAGLSGHRGTKTAFLAGGWKQRLALGCAILHEPPILFLDEPTSGVDPISRRNFWDLIHDLSGKGVTVFVTTHYMDEAEYCDRLGLIYRGELVALGTPEELKTRRMKEEVVEIRTERPQDAVGLLEGLSGVKGAALFGKAIHAVVDRAEEAVPRFRAALENGGFAVHRIGRITPSLEDVFVSLVEERERREKPVPEVQR